MRAGADVVRPCRRAAVRRISGSRAVRAAPGQLVLKPSLWPATAGRVTVLPVL